MFMRPLTACDIVSLTLRHLAIQRHPMQSRNPQEPQRNLGFSSVSVQCDMVEAST